MRSGRIDVHGHLLPGVDDGCATLEESMHCARILVEAGYSHAFCTPHVWPNLPANNVENIRRGVEQLQQVLDERQIPLTVLPGGEMNVLWGWPSLGELRGGQVVTYGLAGRYALFDFWAETLGECRECMEPAIKHLQSLGITLIMGHPERIAALNRDPAAVEWFTERGILLQMNTWCLTEPRGSAIFETACQLLEHERYFLFGTDLHDSASMPNRIKGLEIGEKIVGREWVDRLTKENPLKLLPREIWESLREAQSGSRGIPAEGAASRSDRVE